VRDDKRLGVFGARLPGTQESLQLLLQQPRIVRVKHSGYGGFADKFHGGALLAWRL
jgi:hypothetical protein